MNTRLFPALGLAAVCAAGFGTPAFANLFSNNIDMLVVAEQTQPTTNSQEGTVSYVAFDGGYIEAGDAIAGDNAPSPSQVSQALQAALADHGFQPAAAGAPAIVITYHWGVLRIDHRQIKTPYQIQTNLKARIELVSTHELGAEVENHILGREKGAGMDNSASAPRLLVGPLETIRQDSRQPRIFIVVSAYDYQALTRHDAKLLWDTKLSAQETSGDMDTVIPALIAGGGQYFGKNIPKIRDIGVPEVRSAAAGPAYTPPAPESFQLDKGYIDNLLRQEHARISGED